MYQLTNACHYNPVMYTCVVATRGLLQLKVPSKS